MPFTYETINDQIKAAVSSIASEYNFAVDFSEEANRIAIHSCFTPDMQCPYVLLFEYEYDENSVQLYESWGLSRSFAEGDKTDIYNLFGHTMNILVRNFLQIPCVFNKWLLDLDENDYTTIGGALSFYYGYNVESYEALDEVIQIAYKNLLSLMGGHADYFGSYSNKKLKDFEIMPFLLPGFFAADYSISREDHIFLENIDANISMLELSENEYKYSDLLKELPQGKFVDGIDDKVFIHEDARGNKYCNSIPLDKWHLIEIITQFLKNPYKMICQENYFYILSQNKIWIIEGDFATYWVDFQVMEAEYKQDSLAELLHLNTNFQWKYPVNGARFESLVADLLENESDVAAVRLMGKSNNADGGRDIRIKKRLLPGDSRNKIILGQCKAVQRSVNKSIVKDIRDTIEMYDADGFFLAVTSDITVQLIDHLEKIGKRFDVDWWTEREIFSRLRKNFYLVKKYQDIIDVIE